MGLGGRIALVATNVAMLIPVFIIFIVAAVLATKAEKEIKSFSDQSDDVEKATKYIKTIVITLWVLFAGGLVFMFTIGMFIIPTLIMIPYLYGGIMILFAMFYLAISGMLFYITNTVRNSQDYKKASKDAKSAFNNCLIAGILMVVAAIFMIGYSVYSIHRYRKEGGLTGDVYLGAQAALAAETGGASMELEGGALAAEGGMATEGAEGASLLGKAGGQGMNRRALYQGAQQWAQNRMTPEQRQQQDSNWQQMQMMQNFMRR